MSETEWTEVPVVEGRETDLETLRGQGRALRETCPTSTQGEWEAKSGRPSPEEYVRATHEERVDDLLALRMARMSATPFAFFRGSAGIMAADLASTPDTGLRAKLCGDAHAGNFGLYGTAEGQVVMDINDFDETITGPWEWDVKRLATSLVLAGREAGIGEAKCLDAAQDAVRSYRRTVRTLDDMPYLGSWNALTDSSTLGQVKADDLLEEFVEAVGKAQRNTSAKVVGKAVEEIDERDTDVRRHRFIDDPPVLWHVPDDVKADVMRGVQEYVPTLRESRHELLARFRMSDVAFRVVGTGSVGMRTFVVLLHGNDEEDVVLQVKQAGRSALAGALGESACEHEGRRIVEGARAVQSETDILMGWTTIRDRHYVVRQFRNLKGSLEPTELPAKLLDDYGRLTGALLARAHVRTLHPAVLDGYLEDDKDIDEAIGSFAVEYADRTEADHAELVTAIKAGRLPCDDGSQG